MTDTQTSGSTSYGVHSEVGKLRKVLVCAPGLAHNRLTPTNCDDLLFDDVMWVQNAQRDHFDFMTKMRERGTDISSNASKPLSQFAGRRFDYVVTLCDRVREVCPEFPGGPELIHWSVADPALEGDTDDESYPAFQRTAADIENRVRFMLYVIRQQPVRR